MAGDDEKTEQERQYVVSSICRNVDLAAKLVR